MKLKKRILSACTGAAILLSAFSGLSVSAANVEETPGIQLQTILADNNGTNLWTTQIWGGEHILLNPIWTATDLQDYYYNGNLTFEVKSNSNETYSFNIGLESRVHNIFTTAYWTDIEKYKGSFTASPEWKAYTLPLKDLVDAFPDSEFDIHNVVAVMADGLQRNGTTISFRNVKISSPDDERQYPFIKVNQVGYSCDGSKDAKISYFSKFGSLNGKTFEVVDKISGEVVYSDTLPDAVQNDKSSGESVHEINFDSVTESGTYYIRIPDANLNASARTPRDVDNNLQTDTITSVSFQIGNNVYDNLMSDLMKYYYYQRQGMDLEETYAGDYARENLHPNDTKVVKWSDRNTPNAEAFDISQGWYDAGDYGKYVSSAASAVEDLLLAYELYPEIFEKITPSIPESDPDNALYVNVPSILSEIKWELDMLLKMEHASKDGSFYVAANYNDGVIYIEDTLYSSSDNNSAENEKDLRSHLATSDMAAMLAHAYLMYKDIPEYADFAQTCLDTSLRAWNWVNDSSNERHRSIGASNRIYTFTDKDLELSMYWAAGSLYRAAKAANMDSTPYENYLIANCETENNTFCFREQSVCYNNFKGRSFLGYFYYLYQNDAPNEKIKSVFENFIPWRERVLKYDNYGTNYPDWGYWWGSNMFVAQCSMTLTLGSMIVDGENAIPESVKKSNESAFNYLLGVNPLSFSYVSGYGENCVENIFSAIYSTDAILSPYRCPAGYFTEGANNHNNRHISKYNTKCYIDSDAEYTTNENTIYGNAAMIFLTASIMSRIESEQIKGDVNADGKINVADVVLMQKWLLTVPDTKLIDWKAGDLCEDEKLDVFDLCLMKRELLKQQ